jgi:flavodoxin
MKSLVVFYSRSGNTKKVAEAIAKEVKGDLEELVDLQRRSGPIGFIRSGRDASQKKLARLQKTFYDPSQYDLVIVGTPIWAGNITPAVRTYLKENREKIKDAAFFFTFGGSGSQASIDEMKQLYGREARGTLMLTQREVPRGEFLPKIQKFVSQLIN